jgi:NADH-quinone oxidoreductase subunit G
MANVYVEQKPYQMNPGQNLLQGCLSQGFRLPYFCWHPALGSAGACRRCAVKQYRDQHDEHGKIIMSCLTPVKEVRASPSTTLKLPRFARALSRASC